MEMACLLMVPSLLTESIQEIIPSGRVKNMGSIEHSN